MTESRADSAEEEMGDEGADDPGTNGITCCCNTRGVSGKGVVEPPGEGELELSLAIAAQTLIFFFRPCETKEQKL